MLFALDKEEGVVVAFPSPIDVAARCKGVDVRDGFWLFFADDGSPLEPRFAHPEIPGGPEPASHDFTLNRAMSGRWLQERVGEVRSIQGCGLASMEDLVEALKVNRGKRILPGARRG